MKVQIKQFTNILFLYISGLLVYAITCSYDVYVTFMVVVPMFLEGRIYLHMVYTCTAFCGEEAVYGWCNEVNEEVSNEG